MVTIREINKEVRIRDAIRALHKLKAVTPYQLERELKLGSNVIYYTVKQNRPIPPAYLQKLETWLAQVGRLTQNFEAQPDILQNPDYRNFLESGGVIP